MFNIKALTKLAYGYVPGKKPVPGAVQADNPNPDSEKWVWSLRGNHGQAPSFIPWGGARRNKPQPVTPPVGGSAKAPALKFAR